MTVKVTAYPTCSGCDTPYVLRRVMTFDGKKWGEEWVWQRDCKHRKPAPAKLVKCRG